MREIKFKEFLLQIKFTALFVIFPIFVPFTTKIVIEYLIRITFVVFAVLKLQNKHSQPLSKGHKTLIRVSK